MSVFETSSLSVIVICKSISDWFDPDDDGAGSSRDQERELDKDSGVPYDPVA